MSRSTETALTIAGFVASGAVGWFVTGFIGRPIREFFDLRLLIEQLRA